MNILVLGVDHEIQRANAWRTEEMKAAYRDLLTGLVAKHEVQFICEEAQPTDETVGAQLTFALNLPFPWMAIDMPEEVRRAAGIFEEQNKRSEVRRFGAMKTHLADDGFYVDLKNGRHRFSARVPSDAVREDYMVERAVEYAGEARSIMVLCGNLHVDLSDHPKPANEGHLKTGQR
ncbi:MAG: hypothetical protein WCA19_09060 [Candidatus Acidiferrales bacterium]